MMVLLRLFVRRAAVALLSEPPAHRVPDLSLQLAAQEEELRLLLDREQLLRVVEAVLGDVCQLPVDTVDLADETRQLARVLVGPGEGGAQLLVECLPRRQERDAPLVRLAEDGAQRERLVVGQVEGGDEAQHQVGARPVTRRLRGCRTDRGRHEGEREEGADTAHHQRSCTPTSCARASSSSFESSGSGPVSSTTSVVRSTSGDEYPARSDSDSRVGSSSDSTPVAGASGAGTLPGPARSARTMTTAMVATSAGAQVIQGLRTSIHGRCGSRTGRAPGSGRPCTLRMIAARWLRQNSSPSGGSWAARTADGKSRSVATSAAQRAQRAR